MQNYTSKAKLEQYLMTDIASSMDTYVDYWIEAAENFINNYTGRKHGFKESASASVKYFDGNGKREIIIDDFTEIDSLVILELDGDDVEWTLTEGQEDDYIIYPYDDTPKYKLMLTISSQVGAWYKGNKRIKVTAKWGYSATVPKDIELVATILVADIIKQGRDGGVPVDETLGDYKTSFERFNNNALKLSNIKKILDRYKILEL